MSSTSVKLISECLIKPLDDLSPEAKQPIHFTPFELSCLNIRYSQKGLLFAKPPLPENQHFSITTFLDDLQHSLSATLTHFYPFAARFATRKQENPPSYVIYLDPGNTPGVKFIYATVDVTVSDILNPTDVPLLVHSFFDLSEAISHDAHTLPVLSIQVTELVDGIFIGGSVNHMVADGTSFWNFMATWSEIFRSGGKYNGSISRPPVIKRWVLDGYDPIINIPYSHQDQFIDRFEIQTFKERFFNFSSTAISKLKATANSECNTHNKISSLQAVVALLWKCITRARCLPHDNETRCSLMVSTRSRLNPPLSNDYIGNPVHFVIVKATVGDLMAHGLGWAAFRLHEGVINHDDKAIKERVESWIRSPVIYKMSQLSDPNIVHVGSSPRFDMYGCEFGLGKAVAARSGCTNKGDGKITMYPGREGGGSMDVEVCLLPEYMKNIECDEEFMSALMIN
ncbi:putative quinate O-hydroxycinnamoyltransferase [Helianthus annuus]|nr:putative quinate O-hydroxycinnamoyltransferase [Helianthus annuus]